MRSCSVWPEERKTATLIKISITGSMLTFRSSSRLTIAPGAEWEFCGERRTGGRPLTGLDPFPPWNFRKEIWCGVITKLPISQLYKSKHLLKRGAITRWKSSSTLTKSSLTPDWHLIHSWLNAESSAQSFTHIKIIADLGPSAGRLSWKVKKTKKKTMVNGYNHFSVSALHYSMLKKLNAVFPNKLWSWMFPECRSVNWKM